MSASGSDIRWHLLAARYPSSKSSIGSYSLNLARGLAAAGQEVHIWYSHKNEAYAPLQSGLASGPHRLAHGEAISTHWVPPDWSHKALTYLDLAMDQTPGPRRLFLQFDPHTFGGSWNFHLPAWLAQRKAKGDDIWVMIHRIFGASGIVQSPLAWGRSFMQKTMLSRILASCDRIFVSTSYWARSIEPLASALGKEVTWLPLPSNVSWVENKQRARNLRKAFARDAPVVLGTFGGYDDTQRSTLLRRLVPRLLSGHGERVWLGLGRGSEDFALKLRRGNPQVATQIAITGELDTAALSAHIQACDIMVQPYPTGVDTSRTSIMVGLSHARPIVTTRGAHTEAIWQESECVRLSPSHELDTMQTLAERLIADPHGRQSLGRQAKSTYHNFFSLDRCIETLLAGT